MRLYPRGDFTDSETRWMLEQCSEHSLARLFRLTTFNFTIADGEAAIGHFGLIKPSFLSDNAALWLILSKQDFTRKQVLQGVRLAHEFLSAYDWTFTAEVDPENLVNQRFVVALGFEHTDTYSGRLIYTRGK